MRIHVISDLHFEFGGSAVQATQADVVVLAGDIHTGNAGLEWIRRTFPVVPVVYVMGNHEFYGHSLPGLTEALRRECEGSNIRLLENDSVDLLGYTFLGCTLWTDFALRGNPLVAMETAANLMNDYKVIQNSVEGRRLLPRDTAELHRYSRAWLGSKLAESDRTKTIIVTHHAPSNRSEPPHNLESPLAPAFSSALDGFVKQSGVPLWIHGHSHHNVDYTLGCTRVYSNQRGYPNQLCKGFVANRTIEL